MNACGYSGGFCGVDWHVMIEFRAGGKPQRDRKVMTVDAFLGGQPRRALIKEYQEKQVGRHSHFTLP
jgi:hypothetical protein